jgi:hypothetical protein
MSVDIPIFVDSALVDEQDKYDNGSTIQYKLDEPIDLDRYKRCSLRSASIFFTFPNVKQVLNDTIEFTRDSVNYTITLEPGLYNLDSINESISEQLLNLLLPQDLIFFQPDEATQKVSMGINTEGVAFSITWDSPGNAFFTMLGFTQSGTFTTSTVSGVFVDGESRAALNTVNSIYVHVSFCRGSYYNKTSGSNVIANIPINVAPSEMILYNPINPIILNTNNSSITEFTISLKNEKNEPLDMFGEDFYLELVLME